MQIEVMQWELSSATCSQWYVLENAARSWSDVLKKNYKIPGNT